MNKLQIIKTKKLSKYDEIIAYLKNDNSYWLDNDQWDAKKEFRIDETHYRYIDFSTFKSENLKNEFKYYILYNYKNDLLTRAYIGNIASGFMQFGKFISKIFKDKNSFKEIDAEKLQIGFKFYIENNNLKFHSRFKNLSKVCKFFMEFYDERQGIERDIWYPKDMQGVKLPASKTTGVSLNFTQMPIKYRETVKKYLRHVISKRSFISAENVLATLKYFFNYFYYINKNENFLENLNRTDIEEYLFYMLQDRKDFSNNSNHKYVSNIRIFLEYIQMAEYEFAPKKNIKLLIFEDDAPKKERNQDIINRVKFIPEPVLMQIDNNIRKIDKPQYIPVYILLRETGWRVSDILNLRCNNCLEKIWNSKEDKYNYYLCSDITKVNMKEHKVPIREEVATMVEKVLNETKLKSNNKNNPKDYLFNTFIGQRRTHPLSRENLIASVNRMAKKYDIRDGKGQIYKFKPHSLRHTRAKEYTEQGISISIIQQILGHRSLQMTVHYATVTENTLYENWKKTEDLNLFKVNQEKNTIEKLDTTTLDGESFIRYEYIKKNLDAVRVPFGVCFKPSKVPCKQQMNHCLTCASFCTTIDNVNEYEDEITRVKQQIETSKRCGRDIWAEKNKQYLDILEKTLEKIKQQKLVHKNGTSREEI